MLRTSSAWAARACKFGSNQHLHWTKAKKISADIIAALACTCAHATQPSKKGPGGFRWVEAGDTTGRTHTGIQLQNAPDRLVGLRAMLEHNFRHTYIYIYTYIIYSIPSKVCAVQVVPCVQTQDASLPNISQCSFHITHSVCFTCSVMHFQPHPCPISLQCSRWEGFLKALVVKQTLNKRTTYTVWGLLPGEYSRRFASTAAHTAHEQPKLVKWK